MKTANPNITVNDIFKLVFKLKDSVIAITQPPNKENTDNSMARIHNSDSDISIVLLIKGKKNNSPPSAERAAPGRLHSDLCMINV